MISVVIPALNEADAIHETVTRVRTTLQDAGLVPFEVIVVDDGSNDGTGRIAEEAGARVVRHPHNIGYGGSLKDGVRQATYDTIAMTDADGTYPVDELPTLYARFQEGYDMVVGARTGEHYWESPLKAPLRFLLKKLVEFTASRQIADINSGLRIFRRDKALPFFDKLCDTFSFSTSLTLAFMMTSKFVGYVDIPYHERVGETKVRLFRDSLRTMQYIVEAAVFFNPLKIFVLMSFLCLSGAVVSLVLALLIHLAIFYYVGLGLVLIAVLTFTQGMLAVLLKQIMAK